MDLETNALGVARWMLGIDVGSTTVKVVAVDPRTKEIVWSDYQRHETRQAEKALQLLEALQSAGPLPGPLTVLSSGMLKPKKSQLAVCPTGLNGLP